MRVNKKPTSTGLWVKKGMSISYEPVVKKSTTFKLDVEIVYEDDHLAIVNKPAGLATSGNKFRTLENSLPENLGSGKKRSGLIQPKPVHRLDHGTSGLVLIAKTALASVGLSKLLEKRLIKKKYLAVVHGSKLPSIGEMDSEINHKTAHSKYRLIQRSQSGRYALIELEPVTGRTHQLRIHCARSGFPIVGDKEHGLDYSPGKGLFLCAVSLEFIHPITRKKILASIDMPGKFYRLISI